MHLFALLAALLAHAPAAADAPSLWATVSVGHDHACALDREGRAFCWGYNHAGQLGGRTAERCGIVSESGARSCFPVPSDTAVAVEGGRRFVSLSAGRHRTCALDAEGRAFCWGQVAEGADRCLHGRPCSFAPLPYLPERRFRELRLAGADCFVTRDGESLCTEVMEKEGWSEDSVAPRPVVPGMRPHHFDVFANWPTAVLCAVDSGGAAWCRGSNKQGQLGNGTRPWTYDDPREHSDTLTRVAGDARFRAVLAQGSWTCGLDVAGGAHCWGQRSRERRPYHRDDPEDPRLCREVDCATRPVPVAVAPRLRAISDHDQKVCGLTAAGAAYCWDFEGQARPVQPDLRFAMLAGNKEFGSGSCGVTTGGDLYCWGVVNKPPERVRIAHPAARSR